MKLQIIKIGKPAHSAYSELVDVYSKRLRPIWKIDEIILKAQSHQERAGRDIYARIGWNAQGQRQDPQHIVVTLDERGRSLSSPAFARYMQDRMMESAKTLSIIIGGPYGLNEELRQGSDLVWSLSPAVFPSDMAWLLVWEQLYRVSTIMRGTSYHHDGD